MTPNNRFRIAVSSVLPTLVAVVLGGVVLAVAGMLPWTVLPAVLVALGAQATATYVRLGRPTGTGGRG